MAPIIPVSVLLSSFNGQAYIEEQVNSILNQRGVQIRLLVRDDGSTDGTVDILKKMAAQHANISLILGDNIGVAPSFFALMETVELDDDSGQRYYALADQDDFWLSEKLLTAVGTLEKQTDDQILMYCSAIEYVDQALGHLKNSQIYAQNKIGFGNALVQNIATGCTIVLNRAALRKVVSTIPRLCVMHDWWIYLVVSAFGMVIYDEKISMKYRQHGHNVVGIASGKMNQFWRRWSNMWSDRAPRTSQQLIEFDRIYGDQLDARKRRQLKCLTSGQNNLSARIGALFSRDFQRQDFLDDILIRLMMLIGRF